MVRSPVGQLRIDLVGQYKQVVFFHNLRDLLQLRPGHNGAGGIVGEGHYQNLGPGSDLLQQLLRGQTELVLLFQGNGHCHASCQNGAGHIGHEAGLGHQHLIPRVQHGPHGNVNGLAAAYRHQCLLVRVIVQTAPAFQIIVNLHPQVPEACVGGVEGAALLQGVNAFLPDVPGGIKIRLPHTQGHGILHLAGNIKKFADSRWGNRHDLFR